MTYDEVARELGYADRSGAWRAVNLALKRRQAQGIDQNRREALGILDRVQANNWKGALSGDPRAASIVLRSIEARGRVLGLR